MPKRFCWKPKLNSLKKIKIAVLYGGRSSERRISIKSGLAVYRGLRALGLPVHKFDPAQTPLRALKKKGIGLVFIALHGGYGEDGGVQRELERLGICYTGSGPVASRAAFDKKLAKAILSQKGIPTPNYVLLDRRRGTKALRSLQGPLFLKPRANGSSIGVMAVADAEVEKEAIEKQIRQYGDLIAEEKISGREFTVGILGGRPLPVIELRPKNAFYDYQAKYTSGMTEYLVPAPIPGRWARRMQKIAVATFQALGLRDFSRVDIMTDLKGNPFVLEANSIPGFTEHSLLPKAAREAGIGFEMLCAAILELALKRTTKKSGRYGQKKKKKRQGRRELVPQLV
ncbi:MAG: D-alanine--D-alanine ligase [Candidatus Omnitrophota bacterium]